MADLVTIAEVRTQLGISTLDTDEVLSFLISSVSADVEAACERTFASASGSETITGIDGDTILPSRWPVTAVASLTINGEAVAASTGYDVEGYYIDSNVVRLRFVRLYKSDVVAITYTAGAACPADLKRAVVLLISLAYEERKRVGTASMSAAGYSVTYLPSMWPREVERIINRHRRIWPA
jgi:hypothetical protein